MEMFRHAFSMFTPFTRREEGFAEEGEKPAAAAASSPGDLDELKRQLTEMQKKVDKLSDGDK
jgi:polyhydroxyalkanoate synthesis regulator protein